MLQTGPVYCYLSFDFDGSVHSPPRIHLNSPNVVYTDITSNHILLVKAPVTSQ